MISKNLVKGVSEIERLGLGVLILLGGLIFTTPDQIKFIEPAAIIMIVGSPVGAAKYIRNHVILNCQRTLG